MDYKIIESPGEYPGISVTVKGKAAKLAVIFTRPDRKTETHTIEPEQMITNSYTLKMIVNGPCVDPGQYSLIVKTFSPEEVVCQEEINLSLEKLVFDTARFDLQPVQTWGNTSVGSFSLKHLGIGLQKKGNLPLGFSGCELTVGGARCDVFKIIARLSGETQQAAFLETYVHPTAEMLQNDKSHGWSGLPANEAMFWPGDRYQVKGRLFYSADHSKYVDFVTDMVVKNKN